MVQQRPGVVVLAAMLALPLLTGGAWAADVVQYSYDAAHSGRAAESPGFPLSLEWKFAQPPDESATAPVIAEHTVFWTVGNCVFAIDQDTGAAKWAVKASAPIFGSPAYYDGKVIVGTDAGLIMALSAADGKIAWQVSVGQAAHTPLTLSGSTLYCAARDGKIVALDAAGGGTRWTTKLPDAVYAAPAASGNTVFVACTNRSLYGLNATNGRINFGYSVPSATGLYLEPVVGGNRVFVAGDKCLAALGLKGVPAWTVSFGDSLPAGPCYADGVVYQPGPDANLYAFEGESGRLLWKRPAGMYLSCGLTVAGKTLLAGSDSALVRAYSLDSGKPVWEYNTWHPLDVKEDPQKADYVPVVAPVVADGALYVTTAAGELFKLSAGAFDQSPPEALCLEPGDGKVAASKLPLEIKVAVFDEGSGIDTGSLSLSLDGEKLAGKFLPVGSEFQAKKEEPAGTSLSDGWHTVEVHATDARGNELVRSWKFLADSTYTPPAKPAPPASRNTATRPGMYGNQGMYGRGGMYGNRGNYGNTGGMYGRGSYTGQMGGTGRGSYNMYGRGSGSNYGSYRRY